MVNTAMVEKTSAKKESSVEKRLKEISPLLIDWFYHNARVLPWRVALDSDALPNPYHVWISEIMLQQTRVEAVKGYYKRFLNRLPGVAQLAQVSEDELMKLWQGLGYYNRARNLQKCAKVIIQEYEGIFPGEYDALLTLPGIGEYTAGAIASIAFDKAVPAVDGNVYRIYTRLFADASDITKAPFKRELRRHLLSVIPKEHPGIFNQAWMDLGATVCLPHGAPLCSQCPLEHLCQAEEMGTWEDFPVKPARTKRQITERTVILLEYQGKYLIQKRPPEGLLAGLWEFPAQEGFLSLSQIQDTLREWSQPDCEIELLGRGKHIFSHVEWHMLGYLIHLKSLPSLSLSRESLWVTAKKMQRDYSIPSALRCYYSKLFQ